MNVFPTAYKIPGIILHCSILCCFSFQKICLCHEFRFQYSPRLETDMLDMSEDKDLDIKINFLWERKDDII